MVDQQENRRLLAQFLRDRRTRVTPESVGLPTGPRRRAKGLRREEVAVLAGLSPAWYTYLEQGRDIHPSAAVLDSVARVLLLSEDECRYVHSLVFGRVAEPEPADADWTGDELVVQLVGTFEALPHPVYAVDYRCHLLAWNTAATVWYDDWGALPPARRNFLRWLFDASRARDCLVHWEDEVRDLVARWRSETARWPTDDDVQRTIADLRQRSSHFAAVWNDHEVQEHRPRVRVLRDPNGRIQPMRIVFLRPHEASRSGVVFHIPLEPLPGGGTRRSTSDSARSAGQ
jgi:transcriptional regulator with XRE-family HTH domain